VIILVPPKIVKAISYVQSAESHCAAYNCHSVTISLGNTPSTGNALFLTISEKIGALDTMTITQANVTWTRAAQAANSTAAQEQEVEIWYTLNLPSNAGTSITVTAAYESQYQYLLWYKRYCSVR
jgi:spore germination protein YaaH